MNPQPEADRPVSKSRSVALTVPTWAKVDRIVSTQYTGNRSAYFAELVDRDLGARGMTDEKQELHQLVEELASLHGLAAVRDRLKEIAETEVAVAGGGK